MAAPSGKGPAITAVGRLVLLGPEDQPTGSPGEALLARTGSGLLYAGTAEPRRAGWAYPAAAVVAVLAESAAALGIVGAAIVAVTGGGAHGQVSFVLVLFTGATPVAQVSAEPCLDLLARALGSAASPDRVALFALYPRRLDSDPWGPVDAAWVSAQYLNGELHRKARTPLYAALTRMRAAVLSQTELRST